MRTTMDILRRDQIPAPGTGDTGRLEPMSQRLADIHFHIVIRSVCYFVKIAGGYWFWCTMWSGCHQGWHHQAWISRCRHPL